MHASVLGSGFGGPDPLVLGSGSGSRFRSGFHPAGLRRPNRLPEFLNDVAAALLRLSHSGGMVLYLRKCVASISGQMLLPHLMKFKYLLACCRR